MRTLYTNRARRLPVEEPEPLMDALADHVIGQPAAVESIVRYVEMYQAGLAPEGRPAGVFLLLGPSGTGKTKTVEALASLLHGSEKSLLRIDCGEFQMEHEVAKLIGAPPGYLGHRETHPLLTQAKLNAVTTERSSLSLLLFDEIEKAAPSMTRLLLGVLDKAALRLGDNTTVNFERTMIFLTSNLGAREMLRVLNPRFGFEAMNGQQEQVERKLEKIGINAVRRKFAPEFVNRIDSVVTYQPLGRDSLNRILDLQLESLQAHLDARLGARSFLVDVLAPAREFLLDRGTSVEYGARELKRTILRHLTQPLASAVARKRIEAGSTVAVAVSSDGTSLDFDFHPDAPRRRRAA